MNTVSVKHIPGQQDYLLKEDGTTVLKLQYKQDRHTARIETGNEKRVLMIENEGLLRTRLILKNEYGIRIGSMTFDNFSDTHGSVEIENTKYRFFMTNKPDPELNIYKGSSRRNLIYSCQLSFDDNSKGIRSQPTPFIIAVSWYLFLKGLVTRKPVFNDAIIL